jgi:GH25 family lysozyme M1 (1,4-beta-N-acetylmuramidase)
VGVVHPFLAALTALILLTPSPAAAADQAADNGWAHAGGPTTESTTRDAPAGYPVRGVDVSNHQKVVSWASMYRAGVRFAYAKASEGNYFTDAYYADNQTNAKRNHVYFGGYHYARPDQSSGTQQADYFLDRANYHMDGWSLPPMLDIEWPWSGSGSTYPCYGLNPAQMVTWIGDFVRRIRARTGQRTMIYTNTYWWNPCTGNNTSFGDQPLFIANYSADRNPTLPAGWSRWTLWQYTSTGGLPGDQDVFNGQMVNLAALARGGKPAQTATGAAVRSADGAPALFARGTGNHLRRTTWTSTAGVRAVDLHGDAVGTPVSFVDTYGSQQVFVRGGDNRLRRWTSAGSRWSEWGTGVAGDPSAILRTDGQIDVFARGTSGHLRYWHYDPASRQMVRGEDWGGALAGRVTALYDVALDVLHAWAAGKDGQLKHWYRDNVTGSRNYQNWGGGAYGPPSAYITASGEQHVFARNQNGQVRHWYWSLASGLRVEDLPGGAVTGAPATAVDPRGFQHVWACATTGTLRHWYRSATGTWQVASWGGSCRGDAAAFVTSADYEHVFAGGDHWVWSPHGGPYADGGAAAVLS